MSCSGPFNPFYGGGYGGGPYGGCPDAGYPVPAPSCGCGCASNPGAVPPAPVPGGPGPVGGNPFGGGYAGSFQPNQPYYPPVPAMAGPGRGDDGADVVAAIARGAAAAGNALGFDLNPMDLAAGFGQVAGKVCSGWKTTDGVTEVNTCCTPAVGRRGGRFKVAACIQVSRPLDPWAGRRPGAPGGSVTG